MRYRQVHLDFHTSEKIMGIGSQFDKKSFQEALKNGHVDSITVFSKCHHGWAYHPSKANEIHPGLDFDLLAAQIESAHEIGVKTPVYISAGLDEKMARRRPEWLIRNKDESTTWVKDFTQPGYHRFCFNSPYLDYLLLQVKEVCENYDADGIFLDIVGVIPCYCQNCAKTLMDEGKDPYDTRNAFELAERVYANYTKRIKETIESVKPGMKIFHNGGHIRAGRRDLAFMNTHLELESLPTGGWGYDHFPMSAGYARTLGMDFLGMTGKFHKSWGEFGGFKHPNALRYEAALSAANGAACSIGDQLHPDGEMDIATYDLIGKAYGMLEERENWLEGARNIADIAVISGEAVFNYYSKKNGTEGETSRTDGGTVGAVRILLEGKYLFNVVDLEEDLCKYKLVILADNVTLDDSLKNIFEDYLSKGGKILASGMSGLDESGSSLLSALGVKYLGKSQYKPIYVKPDFDIPSLEKSSYILYENSFKSESAGAKELAILEKPYFNRTVEHFCSHIHTPSSKQKYGGAVYLNDNSAYISFNAFEEYANTGTIFVKEIVTHAIECLIGKEKTVSCTLGAQGIVTVTEQEDKKCKNVHLLYASPVRRGKNIEIIEDILPVYDTKVVLKSENKPKSVKIVPEGKEIDFNYDNNYVSFMVDKFECWQIVEVQY